jgi:N-acylneuraminate cytidylyltransferase
LEFLEIDHILGCDDKLTAMRDLAKSKNVGMGEVAYVGDDTNDIALMRDVGTSFAPANAHRKVKDVAKVILGSDGGNGAIREALSHVVTCDDI